MLSSIHALRKQIGPHRPDSGRFATESIIDVILPEKSMRRGTLVELLGAGTTLATVVVRKALRPEGVVIVVDAARRFYPPAAARLGMDLNRLIVVQPDEPNWLINQALACSAVDAVLCWPAKVNGTMFRRWQLAAERGGSVGVLIRPMTARGSPSWADVRILVEPLAANQWRVEVLDGQSLEIVIDDEGRIHDRLHLVPQLVNTARGAHAE